MSVISSGVFASWENEFEIETSSGTYSPIADVSSWEITIDTGVEEWYDFSAEGFRKALAVSKAINLTFNAKRNIGDTGNDCVAGLTFSLGTAAQKNLKWNWPDGTVVTMPNSVFKVTSINSSGDANTVGGLVCEVISNGKPTVA